MITELIRFLLGYVKFEGICNYPSKFMNIITKENINIWNITCKDFYIKACIKKSDYYIMRSISKATGLHVHITSKHGLPFLISKHKKHSGIVAGALLFVLILYILSLFIWRIDISQTNTINKEEIENVMSDYGVTPGTYIKSIDSQLLEQQIIQAINSISWASVNIRGCVINVEIKERIIPPEIENNTTVSNLVASTDGQIVRNEVYSGKCLVKEGDVVIKGQILVNGVIESEGEIGETLFKRSTGKIYAKTIHIIKEQTPFKFDEKKYLSESINRKAFKFFNIFIPCSFNSIPSENCDVLIETQRENILGTSIPVEFYNETFFPFELESKSINMEQASAILKEKLKSHEENELKNSVILNKEEKYEISNNNYTAEAIYICEENIAVESKLDVTTDEEN